MDQYQLKVESNCGSREYICISTDSSDAFVWDQKVAVEYYLLWFSALSITYRPVSQRRFQGFVVGPESADRHLEECIHLSDPLLKTACLAADLCLFVLQDKSIEVLQQDLPVNYTNYQNGSKTTSDSVLLVTAFGCNKRNSL